MAPPQTNYSKHNMLIPDTPNTRMYLDLSRTDPNATKPFTKRGGFSGTAIDPAWRWMRLTEYFGPCGQGWGAEQLAFHIEQGIAFVCVRIWYRVPNADGTMGAGEICWTPPQWGGSELVKVIKGYTTTSDECLKMAMTDAMGKCAAMYLGLGADIYLGSFEDDKYREESELVYKIKANPELTEQAMLKSEEEIKEKLDGISDLDALDDLWDQKKARIAEIGGAGKLGQTIRQRIIGCFSQTKNDINNGKKAEPQNSGVPAEPPEKPDDEAPEQPTIQEESDRDQSEWTQAIDRQAVAVEVEKARQSAPEPASKPAEKPKQASGGGLDELTPELIVDFEKWFKRKAQNIKTPDELNPFWENTCKPRVDQIEKLDENAHRRIIAEYISCQRRVGGFKTLKQAGQGQNRAR